MEYGGATHDDAKANWDGDGQDGVRDGPKGDGCLPSAAAKDSRESAMLT